MRDTTVNMTTGNPTKLLVAFAIPMMIGNIFQQLYNLVDSAIVGRFVGANALAAIGATGAVTFMFIALCNGIGTGGGIITSQFFGNDNYEKVRKSIANVAYIMVVFPIVVGTVAYLLTEGLLRLLATPDNVMADAVTYMKVMCISLIFVSLYNFAASMLRALGDSRTPLYFLIFACILNTILDFVLVYFLNLGVFGAAVATTISQFFAGVLCLLYAFLRNPYFKLSKEDWKVDTDIIIKTIKLGIPLSLQFSLIAISCMALQRVVNSFGAVAMAAFTATSRIEQVIHQPYTTLGTALSTFSGQNYGANKNDRVILGYKKGLILMAVFTIIMIPVIQIFGRQITALFVTDPEVIEMGARGLRITSWFYLILGVIYVIRGVLSGVGDAFYALLNGIIEVIGRFTVPLILTMIPLIGVYGIWWSVGVVWTLSAIITYIRFIWYRKKRLKY